MFPLYIRPRIPLTGCRYLNIKKLGNEIGLRLVSRLRVRNNVSKISYSSVSRRMS